MLLCALFVACSSDDSATLKEWFDDQGIATSYGKEYQEIEISLKSYDLGHDTSANMVGSYAALGNVNNVEQILYFGLEVVGKLDSIWKLKTDSIFYANFYEGQIPEEHKKIQARFYWLEEKKTEHDTTWLKFPKQFTDSADISIDSFSVSLPENFLKLKPKADTLRLLTGIRLLTNDAVLRIAAPTTSDISGLLRVAQKTYVEKQCDLCLHAGVRESLDVVFEIGKNKIKADKIVVFAQLVLPKSSDNTGSELGHPLPVYVYSDGSLENYRIDTSFVEAHGHPNLVFWEGDTLKLQVTKNLRHLPDTLSFTLRLGTPMLIPKSLYFYNSIYSSEKVFSDRPAFAIYDFSTAFEGGKAKLRLWYAKTD